MPTTGIFIRGAITQGTLDGNPRVRSRGEAPVGGLGDEVLQKLKHLTDIVYRF